MMVPNNRIAIIENICDVEATEKPFGRRYRQEEITLTHEQLTALQNGAYLALDVQEEYVVFLNAEKI